MQTISQAAKLLADHYGFVTLRAYLDGTQITAEIGRGVYTASVGGDELTIGNACAASMQLTVNDALPGIGGKALSITWAVDATEYPLFTGIVEDPAVRAGQTTITAYDAMYYGGADAFSPTAELLEDVGAARALTLIGTAMGVSVAQEAMTLAAGVTIPGGFSGVREDISNAQAAGYVAAILGGNALIDREGNLTVRQYAAVSWETEVYSGGADAKNADYTVTGVTFRRTDTVTVINADGTTSETEATTTYEAGDGTLAMDNPLCDQAAATRAYTALGGVSVRAGSYWYPAGIQIEPGDIITARSMDGSYAVAATSITMTLDGGVKTALRSGGAPPSGGAYGPISQALKMLQADIAHIRQLVAENADINSANIGTLQADLAEVGVLVSTAQSTADGAATAASTAQSTADGANRREQLIYKSAASGTSSMAAPTAWVTATGDTQNAWTTKRPTYSSSYPVLFVATQRQTVGGTVTCTTPLKDDTTTVIDGGHITTGTIDASQATITNINASNIKSGTLSAARIAANSIAVGKLTGSISNGDWKIDLDNGTFTIGNISAGKITSGTIDSDRINTTTLMAKNLKATGTFQVDNGVYKLAQTTGGFSLSSLSGGLDSTEIVANNTSGIKLETHGSQPIVLDTDSLAAVTVNGTTFTRGGNINRGAYTALFWRRKTVTGTTTAAGNISLGVGAGSYGILSVQRTDANGICTPYVYHGTSDTWYAHITNIAASSAAVTNTDVELVVDYYTIGFPEPN